MSKEIARQVREFFKNAHRGKKLTAERRKAIRAWQDGCRRRRYEMIRIERLEKALERRICLKGVYPGTEKYEGRGSAIVVKLPVDNYKLEFNEHKGPSIVVTTYGKDMLYI